MKYQISEQLSAKKMTILMSTDSTGDLWMPVPPDLVPRWLLDFDVMAKLEAGEGAMAPGGENWFIAVPEGMELQFSLTEYSPPQEAEPH